jgi:hypothetical protein
VSRQRLHWWGEDPDGVVRGYLFAYSVFPNRVTSLPVPDTLRYTWVTSNDTLILFPLDTLFRTFTVFVRAVDNRFGGIPNQSPVRMSPSPFWDKNNNGMLDGNDEFLSGMSEAVDPIGAVQTFPVRNTPPRLEFAANPNDPGVVLKQPDTTFTAATFAWKGSDDDGDNTLSSYRIALNDTSDPSRWLSMSLRDTVITLVVPRMRSDTAGAVVNADIYSGTFLGRQFLGEIQGLRLDSHNVLYVQARDVAGEYSPMMSMPSGSSQWFVKRPRGRILIVSDYINTDSLTALTTYLTALSGVPGGEFANADQINIGRGLNANSKKLQVGVMVPGFIDPALIYTFLTYDYVLWYTDQFPSLGVAQLTLFTYMQNGGKVIFTTTFESSADPRGALRDFAPIDSISSVDLSPTRPPVPPPVAGDTRIYGSYMVFADSTSLTNLYPNLQFNGSLGTIHSIFMRPVYRRSDARYVLHLQASHLNRYLGTPNVGVVDGQRRIVFIGLPLHLVNNTTLGNGLTSLFTRMVTQEFRPSQRINRRVF